MNGETITLTQRAQQRLKILHALDRADLLMREAADLLGLSVRQVRRLRSAYRRLGPKALVHGNQGHPSPRRVKAAIRARILHLAQTTYAGVNHKHLTELLAEREGLTLSHPTVHRILRQAGVRSPRRRRPPRHRRRRERMPQPGLLVQLDGSHHTWLEDRGPRLVLLAAIDDASSEVLAAAFRDQEDAHGYLVILREMARAKGLPVAVYSDRHGVFHRDKRTPVTLAEQLRGGPDPTQVGRVLHELSIRWVPASSPQAKGRIERLFQTFQDRLRVELRLAGVKDRDGANTFLHRFLPRYNARFSQSPAATASAFRPWPATIDPDTIFCFKYWRIVGQDNVVTLGTRQLQVLAGPHGRSYAKARVEVQERLDGTIAVVYQGHALAFEPFTGTAPARIPAREYRRAWPRGPGSIQDIRRRKRKETGRLLQAEPGIPNPDHPWRHMPVGKANRQRKAEGTKSLNS